MPPAKSVISFSVLEGVDKCRRIGEEAGGVVRRGCPITGEEALRLLCAARFVASPSGRSSSSASPYSCLCRAPEFIRCSVIVSSDLAPVSESLRPR